MPRGLSLGATRGVADTFLSTKSRRLGGHQLHYPRVVACSATPGLLSEGPRWLADRAELLWVDILGSQLHRAQFGAGGMLESPVTTQIDRHVGAAAPAVGGGYVLAAGPGFLFVESGGAVRELAQLDTGRTAVRMNDGACDPQGRFWAHHPVRHHRPAGAGSAKP